MKQQVLRMVMAVLAVGMVMHAMIPAANAAGGSAQAKLPAPEGKIVNVAHRGASGHAPEHTIASYELGIAMKADYIEIDLQMTKDDVLVAMHDQAVNRTTNGSGYVRDYMLEELKKLDAGSWFNASFPEKAKPEYAGLQVPTLEEIFQRFGRSTNYYIETKSPAAYPGMEEKLLELMEKYHLTGENGRSGKVIIQSFHPESLLKIHELQPDIPLVQLISRPELGKKANEQLEQIKQYAIGVGPNFSNINKEYVQTVRGHGLLIHPYTVNTEEAMKTALSWGVTGLFTDYPDVFHKVMKKHKR
ncbi:glycerophosphoryl diester phosphodiesterase [Evansella caseinilytica]|uniref:Glycerophosphoryl diester phosphodiesterase n=1 Tax=Evansella caseinilytica TaxID=1503961 RepID=A0A1H3RI54_9BACI|nr:glycerophosphodiester phosphodiesterase [Evansella caseinilytica]SDZ25025.1 glycerophosphoryl diester phosphodiesterase [Evansella caseinilytica]